MAESKVRLPSGVEVVIKHKDEASEEDVLKFAFNEYVTNQDPGTKIGSSIAQGIDTLQQAYGSSLEGLGEILDAESLQQLGGDIVLKNQAEIDARLFRESQAPTDQSQVAKALDYVSELAGQSAPQMATAMGGAAIGGAIGTLGGPLAPLTIPAGAFLGGFISNMPYFYGSNRERQKEAIEKGYKTEVDEGAAMLAAIPQSSLDAIVSAVGAKFIATPAMKMSGGFFTKVAKGSAAGSLIEVPTEIGQTVLERAQAGLPLTGDEAFSEYIDAGVGGAVLGGLFGGAGGAATSVRADFGKDSAVGTGKTKKSDLKKEVEDRPALEVPRTVQVEYKELDGQVRVFPLAVTEGQDPMATAEEALAGRYDPAFGLTVTDRAQPVGPEQELDLPDQAPDPTQEEVPVQPEAAVPTQEQAPVEQAPVEPETAVSEGIGPYDDSELTEPNSITGNVRTLNEIFDRGKKTWENTSGDPRRAQGTSNTIGKNFGEKAKEAHMRGWKSSMEAELKERQARKAPTPEQAPEARSFSLPQNLSKTAQPKYQQSGEIKFASDLERAAYSATTSTSSDPAKRKRTKYRKLLQDAGYSSAEINAMGREVRSQMRDQYDLGGPGSELFVALPQDVVAEASATYIPKRYVGEQAEQAPPFFQSFSPEQYDEGRFVDLETKKDLSDQTFEGGSIRIEGGRPVLETSDNASETILDSKASEEGPLVRTNLFKQKAGWKWTKAPDGAPSTIVSVEQGPKHYYTLDFSSAKPLTLKTYPSKKSEPRGRPTTRGKVKLGNPVGEISIRGKKHTVYDRVTVGEPDVVAEAAQQNEFKEDIPNEQWLKDKVEDVIDQGTNKAGSPRLGSTTGYFKDLKPIKLSLETTKNVKGYNGEHLRLDQSKVDKLTKELEVDGKFEYPPLIGIAHNGEPYIIEGNHRIAASQKAGIPIDIEVKYFDGGQRKAVEGWKPDELKINKKPDVVAEAAPLDKVSSKNQVDVVDSTVTKLVDPVDTDPAEGGKVRSIAKRFALKTGIIDFKKLFKTTGALKVSERVYKSTVKKAAEKISKVLDKSFIQFPKFEAWYSSRLNMAMKIFQELDPDLSKPEDQFIMKTLLAVTSNGNEVSDQTAESFRIYQDWKRTGTLDQKSTQGTREETILEHLRLVDVLIAKVGWKDLEAFMSKVGPVSELRKELQSRFGFTKKQAKDMTNGELVTEVVPYSLFLGPKLGSFFNNLSGNFDTTTMDRWFMRTFGRTMGDQLVKVDIQKPKQRLIEAIDSLIADPGSNLFKTLKGLKVLPKFGKAINANQIKRIATYFALKANRQGLSSVENEVRLAINGMVKVSDGFKLMEAPASGSHRRFIRAVMKEALDDFNKRNNTNFTPAEAQAILWYYEKLIHESNGSRQKGEAPDYAAGANAIYRSINGRDSGQFVRSDVIRRRGDLSGGTQELQQGQQPDVTAQAAQPEVEDRGPQDTFDNGGQVMDFVESTFDAVADKIGIAIRPAMGVNYVARYNATQQVIEYNPMALLNRSKSGVKAAMREEIIHAAMHNVLMQQQRKTGRSRNPGDVWVDFFETFAKTLTAQERVDIGDVYQSLTTYHALGAEYSRAVVQNLLYGEFSEQYQMQSKGGPAWDAIVQLLRSVQAYMAKVLGPMRKTNPEAAQLIVDSVELLKAADPSIRPKNQDVVAQAYDATDKNTAKENTEAGERVGQDASDRVRDERKWFESEIFQRDKISKALTPVVTRLRRINVKFARLFSKLDEKIRFRNLKYRKQSVNFFNKLNAIKGNEFLELKQLIFFSPTPQEADSFTSKNRIQRRDALLHKHGLLNMYRLDVQPILEELYIEYNKSGMPDMGYLEDYFPHVINDLNGLIKSYGHKTKRTFEVLVRDENLRRSKITDKNGDPAGLPEMDSEERARFFQDFLQNKLRKDLNGVNIPANAKGRSIALIPEDKLKFYDDPGQAFGKYTSSMVTALENYKVIGSTNKSGELGELGQLTEDLFNQGLIDQADVDQLKSLTELATVQFSKENPIFRLAGVFTYASTLIDVGTVAVQVLDLYKVLMQRGPSAMLKGVYRTVTGNREYDLERDFGFSEKQIMAEFDDHGFGDKALAFGLRYIVPFQQMDAAMKHSSVEAALIDFLRKAKSDVGSKKYNQLVDELTITLGREDAMKAVTAFRLDRYKDSPEAKAALSEELLQRQPMTYLQVPETYRRNPGSRLFYKLKTFMLLDINFNREMALNDLLGPEKTLKQRTKALKILTSMALALAAIGMPKDMLMDWIRGKDTYLPDHVANALLGIFGLNKYALKTVFESGPIDAVADRFTPAAYNIFDNIEDDLMSWVNGNKEISEFQMWANAPLFDVWGRFTDKFKNQQERIRGEKRKKGQRPTIQRF